MYKSIYDNNFDGKNVLIRVDFNVPLDKDLNITDDNRIEESLSTIDKIIDDGGIPILMSHLGRPKGEKNLKYSLAPIAVHLDKKFGYKVHFAKDCIGPEAKNAIKEAEPGSIVLLENLRFYKEEEANDPEFAKKIAELGDCYINDAFGSAHRAHASTHAVAMLFKDRFAGKLMLSELEHLGKVLKNPQKPFVAVIGGSKISGKIDVIRNLLGKCETIIIGGGMMFTFYKAMGLEIGKSILEEDKIELAKELINEAKSKGVNLVLPEDVIVAAAFENEAESRSVSKSNIPTDWIGMDIGLESRKTFVNILSNARTVLWNGPMGVFEMDNFAFGTYAIAKALADVTAKGASTIIGGGDSAAAIKKIGLQDKVTHVSTGGGASLEFLEGKILPGVAALDV
ncbi:MAG: pgk [Ignavibacteria bacterium]|nr:pgk [Ignavibacteria bacterium]